MPAAALISLKHRMSLKPILQQLENGLLPALDSISWTWIATFSDIGVFLQKEKPMCTP